MMFTIFTAAILATSAMAAPTKRASQPTVRDDAAGVMLLSEQKNPFTAIEASFTVPEVKVPASANGDGMYTAHIWTGLGMDANKDFKNPGNSSLIRIGVRASTGKGTNGSSVTTYNAFYDILPDLSVIANSTAFDVKPGDSISADIHLESDNAGHTTQVDFVIKNARHNQTIGSYLSKQNATATAAIKGGCADFVVSGDSSKLPDFGTVNFAIGGLGAHGSFGPDNGTVADAIGYLVNNGMFLNMGAGGKNLAETKVLNSTSLQVKYVGA